LARVVITDGDSRASLAIVRSLARAGHDVAVCSSTKRSLAGVCRYAHSRIHLPDVEKLPGPFAEGLNVALARNRPAVLIPVTEASIRAVLNGPPLPESVALPFGSPEAFQRLSDKRRVLAAASGIGLSVPRQAVLLGPEDMEAAVASHALSFPVAIKASSSVSTDAQGRMRKHGVAYARNVAEMRVVIEGFPLESYPLLVQEYIRGAGVGVFLLRWDGRLVASFSHERLREKPPSGGVSVRARSRSLNVALRDRCEALLAASDWNGVAMVEFKEQFGTGELFLMEVNARFWGSLQLAVDSGVDFPTLLVDCILGQPLPAPAPSYESGVQTRWFWGEVDHFLSLLAGERHVAVSGPHPPLPSLLRTAIEVVSPLKHPAREAVFRMDDPVPFLQETSTWIGSAGHRLVQKLLRHALLGRWAG
jgi:predicted ATP-grasp superfamily ATP-dependent carboligase